jgi:FkbM family methyltransferase
VLASNIKTALTRYGEMSYYVDDMYIGGALEKYGEYCELEVALWRRLVGPEWVVFDVGANIGASALALASLLNTDGGGIVYAFEPQPENYDLLARNTEDTDLIVCFQSALGKDARPLRVPRLAQLGHKNYGDVRLGQSGELAVVDTLDNFANGKRVDFIKIDVQGMEADVLEGGSKTIKRFRPVIQAEIDQPQQAELTLRKLRALGYRCYRHTPSAYNPDNFNGDHENLWPGVCALNAVAFPEEKLDDFRPLIAEFDLQPIVPAARAANKEWAAVCRFGGIGDNLMAASVLRPLKAAGYKVEVISQMPQAAVFEHNPFIDKLTIKDGKRDFPQTGQLDWNNWFRFRSYEYGLFANLSHSCELAMALLPAQTAYWWPAAFRRKHYNYSYVEYVHDVFGMPYEFGPLFFANEEEKEAAQYTRRAIGAKRLIGWVLTGTRVDKIYPQAGLAVARAIRELDAHVVMFGAPSPSADFQFAQQIQQHVKNQNGSDEGLHLALSPDGNNPSWPIRRVLAMAQACDLVIGPDTGPLWGAAFEQMPKIVLLSHASPENITKHWINTVTLHADPAQTPCWPCHCLHDTIDTCLEMQRAAGLKPDADEKGAACITSISVETIIKTAHNFLKENER